ncbi:MAG: alpha/beta fold hydrolase [Micrococcales bacterium]
MTPSPQHLALLAAERAVREEILIDGVKTAYWRYPAEGSAKPEGTIAMVHGYRGNHLGLAAIVGALPSFDVIVPDLPGFGDSDPIERHDIGHYRDWLTGFVSEVAGGKSIIVAHSFGTIVASAAAANGMRNDLVLLNPISVAKRRGLAAFRQSGVDFFNWLACTLPSFAGNALTRNWLAVQAMSSTLAKTHDSELRAWIHRQHHENFSDFKTLRVATEGYVASTTESVLGYAPEVANRVLLVAGELDEISPLENQRQALGVFGSAQLEVIPGVGHLIHYEKPAEAAALISGFAAECR